MTPDPDRKLTSDLDSRPDFRSPADPSPRAMTRTISRLDGFPAKLEPRKDLYRVLDRKDGWTSRLM